MEAKKNMEVISSVSIEGIDTVSQLFLKRIVECDNKVAMREKDFGVWNEYTWADWGNQAKWVGLGLKSLGFERGDVCSIASEINKEWIFADLGVITMLSLIHI